MRSIRNGLAVAALLALTTGPAPGQDGDDAAAVPDARDRVAVVEGLAGPEAVHYDPDQDVYFISNFDGEAAGDANGFISRVAPDGDVLEPEFMSGTPEAPLHGPRGMRIDGELLWVADAEGLHAFDRRSGAHRRFIDFSHLHPGFLNDVAVAPDGTIYLTDTGEARLFRIEDGRISVAAADELVSPPNGVVWMAGIDAMVLAPWGGGLDLVGYRPDAQDLVEVASLPDGGNIDGIEPYAGGLLVASQVDRSIWFWRDGEARRLIRTPGRPADIGVDTRRKRIAVPYIALDRVDIWALPEPQ